MINYRIYFIRHGFCEENKNQICIGSKQNPHICLDSIKEIENYKKIYGYPVVNKVYSSPLYRCLETAELIYNDNFIETVHGLQDIDMGVFGGKSFEQLQNDDDYISWLSNVKNTPLNGQNFEDFESILSESLNHIISDILKNKIMNTCVITHSMCLMNIMSRFGLPKTSPFYWNFGYAKGVSVFLSSMLWGRDNLFEVSGIVPYGMESFK